MDPLRALPLECPFWSSRVTLGLATEAGITWTGSWSTDLFEVTCEDAARLLAEKTRG